MNREYDKIGTGYNSTRQADPYLTERIVALLAPKKDGLYLDLGCGTGNYTRSLAARGLHFIGIDPSVKMLTEARKQNQNIKWLKGAAEQIPFPIQIFDGIVSTLTIHHWTNIKTAFFEIRRVLSDHGRFVVFTSTPNQMEGYWLNHYFPKMLRSSIYKMPSLDSIRGAAKEAGLELRNVEEYSVKNDLQDHFLYVGKHDPEYYFDEQIRRGISSFSTLSSTEEVEQGLSMLKSDIENGAFKKIRNKYENNLGDYLFLTFEKK